MRYTQTAANLEVTFARGGSRRRDSPEEITVTPGADGAVTVIWPEPGMDWMNASSPALDDPLACNAQYDGVLEVLP